MFKKDVKEKLPKPSYGLPKKTKLLAIIKRKTN